MQISFSFWSPGNQCGRWLWQEPPVNLATLYLCLLGGNLPPLPSIDGVCFSTLLKPGCPCGLLWSAVRVEVMCEFRNSGGLTSSTQGLQPWVYHAMKRPGDRTGDKRPRGGEQGPHLITSTNCQTQEQDHFRATNPLAKCNCTGEPRWNQKRNHQKRKCFKPLHLGVVCYATAVLCLLPHESASLVSVFYFASFCPGEHTIWKGAPPWFIITL